jgi:hypothetical protein
MQVIIHSVLPNPAGSDKEGEWIVLKNRTDTQIALDGWTLEDASGKKALLNGVIGANEERTFTYKETKLSLNNNEEKLILYDNNGVIAHEVFYEDVSEEEVVVFNGPMNTGTEDALITAHTAIPTKNDPVMNERLASTFSLNDTYTLDTHPIMVGVCTMVICTIFAMIIIQKMILGEDE